MEELTLRPVAFMRCPEFLDKRSVARQPTYQPNPRVGLVEWVDKGFGACAAEDIQVGDRLWLLFWFHKQTEAYLRPKVLPPTSKKKVGLFSTRSPYRPNPLGLTKCEVVGLAPNGIQVMGHDLLDGTPIFDIKPYIVDVDADIDAPRPSWLTTTETPEIKMYEVVIHPTVLIQFKDQPHVLEALRVQLQQDPHNELKNKRIRSGVFAFERHRFAFEIFEDLGQVHVLSSYC